MDEGLSRPVHCSKGLQPVPKAKQGVALTGRNTTGPPSRVASLVSYVAYWSVTDDDRRQRTSLVWSSYTMCRRASNNYITVVVVISSITTVHDGIRSWDFSPRGPA